MPEKIPVATIAAMARSIVKEAHKYGFDQVDIVRLVNEILDGGITIEPAVDSGFEDADSADTGSAPASFPLTSSNVRIRAFDPAADLQLLKAWLPDKYGRYFVLSSASARSESIDALVRDDNNLFGIITLPDASPIGALAFLDYTSVQKKAELRKLIGEPDYRGIGLAEEATRLWVRYGFEILRLDKIFVSTLQTHLSNIKLNERIGFKVEGLLQNEVLIDGVRHDVLRMGICRHS